MFWSIAPKENTIQAGMKTRSMYPARVTQTWSSLKYKPDTPLSFTTYIRYVNKVSFLRLPLFKLLINRKHKFLAVSTMSTNKSRLSCWGYLAWNQHLEVSQPNKVWQGRITIVGTWLLIESSLLVPQTHAKSNCLYKFANCLYLQIPTKNFSFFKCNKEFLVFQMQKNVHKLRFYIQFSTKHMRKCMLHF